MKKKKLAELRERMVHHGILDDKAVVVLYADELQELLDIAESTKRTPSRSRRKRLR